jgi:uncharacterized protein (DUF2141 family)
MKLSHFATAFALVTATAAAIACPQLEIHNVRAGQGALMVAVYADAASYNKKPELAKQITATDAVGKLALCGMEGKTIAVAVFQDFNLDGKLGMNVMGIPTEPYGASGKPPAFSAPTWETTNVKVGDAPLIVTLSN